MAAEGRPVVLRRVAAFLEGTPGVPPGSHLLVAVSGGPDSTALAAVLAELRPSHALRISLAHVPHGLRAAADEAADEALVRELAAGLGTTLLVEPVQIDAGPNLEARARVARQRALRTAADAVGARYIALGHTLDDQAETVLLRLLRGGGRRGLGGMRAHDGRILRPLLAASRADVRWYVAARRLRVGLDRSNADLRFTRNRVRRLLLPLLTAEFNPRLPQALADLAGRLRDEDDLLDALAREHGERLCVDGDLHHEVALLPPALARRVVRLWLAAHGLGGATAVQVERVRRAATRTSAGAVVLPGPRRVLREGERIVCRPGLAPAKPDFRAAIAPGGAVCGPGWELRLSEARRWQAGERPQRDAACALLDADALPGPFEVRTPRHGDRVHVPRVGTRKLQDVLTDRKVPRERRAALPVLTAGELIVWVPGVVRSSAARPDDGTRWVLEARLVNDDKVALPLTKPCGNVAERGERAQRGPR